MSNKHQATLLNLTQVSDLQAPLNYISKKLWYTLSRESLPDPVWTYCVMNAAVSQMVLHAFGFNSLLLPVRVEAQAIDRVANHKFSLGIGDPSEAQLPDKLNMHAVVLIMGPGGQSMLFDPTVRQYSRPDRGMTLPDMIAVPTYGDPQNADLISQVVSGHHDGQGRPLDDQDVTQDVRVQWLSLEHAEETQSSLKQLIQTQHDTYLRLANRMLKHYPLASVKRPALLQVFLKKPGPQY